MGINVTAPTDINIKKENVKLENSQGLKEKLERLWKMRDKVVAVAKGALGGVTSKLEE